MVLSSVQMTSTACLSILDERSLVCCSFWGFVNFFPVKGSSIYLFILIQFECIRTEIVKPYETDMKFMILSSIIQILLDFILYFIWQRFLEENSEFPKLVWFILWEPWMLYEFYEFLIFILCLLLHLSIFKFHLILVLMSFTLFFLPIVSISF